MDLGIVCPSLSTSMETMTPSRNARRILNRAGVDVARAVYAKELAVSKLPDDAEKSVSFGGAHVTLGEVDAWLRRYARRQARGARLAAAVSVLTLAVSVLTFAVVVTTFILGIPVLKEKLKALLIAIGLLN